MSDNMSKNFNKIFNRYLYLHRIRKYYEMQTLRKIFSRSKRIHNQKIIQIKKKIENNESKYIINIIKY